MRTIQEIFNAVLDYDEYCYEKKLMCWAIQHAEDKDVITEEESCFAIAEIESYLEDWVTLGLALRYIKSTIPPIEVYRDWANRPTLKH